MSRLIDADTIPYLYPVDDDGNEGDGMTLKSTIDEIPTVKAIPYEEVKKFISSIQKIKDDYNEGTEPINYGTICGILIEGYRLLDKALKEQKE